MSASGRQANSKRRQVQSAIGSVSGNGCMREAMPRQRPIKATAFNTAAIFSGNSKEEEVVYKPQFCLPFKALPNEDSDVSLLTARCVTDRISQETPSDVVWKAGGGDTIQDILHALQKRGAYRKNSNKREEEDIDEEFLEGIVRASAAGKGVAGDCCLKCSLRPRPEQQQKQQKQQKQLKQQKQQKQPQQQPQLITDGSEQSNKIDASELLQLLIGIVYGSDNRKVHIGRRMVESSPSVSGNVGLKAHGASSGVFQPDATDQSEMMTLSCGDITQSKTINFAQLQEAAKASHRSGDGSGGGGSGSGGEGCGGGGNVGGSVCGSGGDAGGGLRAAAIPTVNAVLAERIRRACHRSNNCSVLTFNGSEAAPATATIVSALNEEIIPPSDRAGKSSAGDAGCVSFCECNTTDCQREHANSHHHSTQSTQAHRSQREDSSRSQTGMSRSQRDDASASATEKVSRSQCNEKRQQQQHRRQQTTFGNSDVTVESKVVLELENLETNSVADGIVDYCTCNDDDNSRPVQRHRRVNRRRSRSQRFGRLRTPEICKRTQTTCSATAAEVEWEETGLAPSVSDRHEIDTSSEGSCCSESSGSTQPRKTKRRQRSVERRKTARKVGGKKPGQRREASRESQKGQKKKKKPPPRPTHRNRSRDS